MPFVDMSPRVSDLESSGLESVQAKRAATHVGRGEVRRHLIPVAILSDMVRLHLLLPDAAEDAERRARYPIYATFRPCGAVRR